MNTNKHDCCQHCNTNMIFLYYQQQDLILVHTQENIKYPKNKEHQALLQIKDKTKNLITWSYVEEKENVFKLHLRYL